MAELKPCNCRSQNIHLMYDVRPVSKYIYRVKCFECGARTAYYDKPSQAIDAWNKRS